VRWFEELCFGRGRAGWLNGYDVPGETLDIVCSLETWVAMMIKSNTPIVVRMFSCHRTLNFYSWFTLSFALDQYFRLFSA
jgi:hypothetical protein